MTRALELAVLACGLTGCDLYFGRAEPDEQRVGDASIDLDSSGHYVCVTLDCEIDFFQLACEGPYL